MLREAHLDLEVLACAQLMPRHAVEVRQTHAILHLQQGSREVLGEHFLVLLWQHARGGRRPLVRVQIGVAGQLRHVQRVRVKPRLLQTLRRRSKAWAGP